MDQALTNIFENAARHSPSGADICLTVTRAGDGVRLSVSDRGPGIPVSDRELVFEPFFSRDRNDARAGTGLGLAIARAVIQAHDGSISIQGEPDDGTTVVIDIPRGMKEKS
jgi:signal transduction histidine kinase